MAKTIVALILSLTTTYSSLAGVAVEIHLIDHHHDHNKSHLDQHKYKEKLIFKHIITLAQHHEDADHSHQRLQDQVTSVSWGKVLKLYGAQALITFLNPIQNLKPPSFLSKQLFKKAAISYSPPPDRFRNLPLLN